MALKKPRPHAQPHEDPPQEPPADPREDTGIEEDANTHDVAGLDSALTDYIAQENLDETNYRASLYQFDKVNKGKQHLLDCTIGTILTPHDVGLAYGSGEYRYVVTWPKSVPPKIKAFKFNLGQAYDLRRAMNNPPPLPGTPGAPIVPPGPTPDPIGQALQIVGALVQLQKTATPPAPPPADIALTMAQNHAAMQQILQQSSMQYIEFMREVRKRFASWDAPEDDEDLNLDETEDTMDDNDVLVTQIKALAVEYLPKLLGDGLGAKVAATAIKATPQFRRVLKDGPTLAHLLSELEKDFGKEKVDEVCTRLKVKRPA